ncbi:MAG TPA: hypothetical protein PKO06_19455 [Candidatus Ozemobacteraceae bacterium]|nr:hypothetical protein [Candidatus Ozemobacteraceae bacterium]
MTNLSARVTLIRKMVFSLVAAVFAVVLAGCGGGGGGGGGIVTPPVDSVHTTFEVNPARIRSLGAAYNVSVIVRETRGDAIDISRMRTYRTWETNLGQTGDYYAGTPRYVEGWMFTTPSGSNNIRDAVVYDTSSAYSRDLHRLQAYESRTISTQVMVGNPYQSRPSGFYGIFITNSDYRTMLQSHRGMKFWVRLEGYDQRLGEEYNIMMPLEIWFDYNPTDPYGGGSGSDTDPYDDPYNPYGGSTGGSSTDPYANNVKN